MKRVIHCDSRAPAAARRHVAEFLSGPNVSTDVVDDVILAVSELVTNAVEAGATLVELGIYLAEYEITLSVNDDTGGWPTLVLANPYTIRGRGLAIVAEAADYWDVQRTRYGKKVTACFATKRDPA